MGQINETWPNGMPEIGQTAQMSREVTSRTSNSSRISAETTILYIMTKRLHPPTGLEESSFRGESPARYSTQSWLSNYPDPAMYFYR